MERFSLLITGVFLVFLVVLGYMMLGERSEKVRMQSFIDRPFADLMDEYSEDETNDVYLQLTDNTHNIRYRTIIKCCPAYNV